MWSKGKLYLSFHCMVVRQRERREKVHIVDGLNNSTDASIEARPSELILKPKRSQLFFVYLDR